MRVIHGDCLEILPTLQAASIDCVVTSPPYAKQRGKQYGGIDEAEYPAWTAGWMGEVRRVLKPAGSVLVNIREHVRGGQISDYVHRTRLAVRAAGWAEVDELIWVKPAAMPVGRTDRPRRSWERVLWFAANARDVRCFAKANGRPSERIGIDQRECGVTNQWVQSGARVSLTPGVSRCRDYVSVAVGAETASVPHPAKYPVALAAWLVRLVCPPNGVVLDPFAGSGTTGIAAMAEGRDFIGIEKESAYVEIARARIEKAEAAHV